MATLRSDSRLDMTTLFDGYRLSSGSVTQSGTSLSFSLYYPGGYYPSMTVTLTGAGFTFAGDGTPTGGTVTGMTVILDRYDSDEPSAWLEDVSVPLTSVLPSGPSTMIDVDHLFATVLSGTDTIELDSGSIGYGDSNIVNGFSGVFGNDTMTLTGTDGALYGDVQVILSGTNATGGADILRATGLTEYGLRLIGDAQGMTGGVLRGGADDLRNDAGGSAYGENLAVGDVQDVSGSATLIGGNDTMIGASALADQMYGDAQGVYSAGANVTGGHDAMNGRGGNDLLYGDVDIVEGGMLTPGNDTLVGGEGNDTLFGDYARLYSGGIVNPGGHDLLLGGEGNDALVGNGGNDTLDGGPGADTLVGGPGDDVYIIDADDVISEREGEGFDVIHVAGSYSLGDHAEVLLLLGVDHLDGTGNALANTITGNDGNNLLNGALGNDTLIGGGGNDIFLDLSGADRMEGGTGDDLYYVDDAGDLIVELTSAGIDRVETTVSFSLRDHSQHLETLELVGQDDIDGTGNGLHNLVTGNGGANVLNGAWGNDTLIGGDGDDTFLDDKGIDRMEGGRGDDVYRVDNVWDRVIELPGEGTDRVESTVTYALRNQGHEIENLTLLGAAAIDGTGNVRANTITGSNGPNVLNGAWGNDTLIGLGGHDRFIDDAGADSMIGGAGNDYYLVDNPGDRVVELAGEGFDRVDSTISFSLGDHIETLFLLGTADIDGTGNGLNNTITGNNSANVLNGGGGNDTLIGRSGHDRFEDDAGADRMVGGWGNDTYLVDNAGDTVVEQPGQGYDRVESAMSIDLSVLSENVEALVLTGNAAVNGSGNALSNNLTGNGAANRLSGGNGADTLTGGPGRDTLDGGAGADTFRFAAMPSTGVDRILDFGAGADRISLVAWAFGGMPKGALAASAYHAGTAAADAADRIIYDTARGALRFDPDGTGSAPAVLFAELNPGTALSFDEIFVA